MIARIVDDNENIIDFVFVGFNHFCKLAIDSLQLWKRHMLCRTSLQVRQIGYDINFTSLK